jgi:hypothetical protein
MTLNLLLLRHLQLLSIPHVISFNNQGSSCLETPWLTPMYYKSETASSTRITKLFCLWPNFSLKGKLVVFNSAEWRHVLRAYGLSLLYLTLVMTLLGWYQGTYCCHWSSKGCIHRVLLYSKEQPHSSPTKAGLWLLSVLLVAETGENRRRFVDVYTVLDFRQSWYVQFRVSIVPIDLYKI